MSLPFLIVHGAIIAKLLVAAFGGTALAVMWFNRARRERTLTASLIAINGAAPTPIKAGPVALRGTLAGRAKTIATEIPTYERDADLVLDVGGERIAIEGNVNVVRGTTATLSRRVRTFAVGPGDDVIAQGTLVAAPAAGYRSGTAWVMHPSGGSDAIDVTARRPMIQPPAVNPVRLIAVIGAWLLVGYGVLHAVGTAAVKQANDSVDGDKRDGHELSTSLLLAAALPGSREDALRKLVYQLEDDWPQNEHTMALRYAAAELYDGCQARAKLQLQNGRYSDALDCPAIRPEALLLLGRYAEAAALLPITPLPADSDRVIDTGIAAIGAGHWAEAAKLADAAASRWLASPATSDPDDALIDKVHGARLTCLAAWFRLKAGDLASQQRLHQLAAEPEGATVCKILDALQLAPNERAEVLAAAARSDRRFEFGDSAFAADLAWIDSTDDDGTDLWHLIAVADGHGQSDRIWFTPVHSDRRSAAGVAAVRALVLGDPRAALAAIARARALPQIASSPSDLDALEDATRLHTPTTELLPTDPERAWAYEQVAAEAELRRGAAPAKLELSSYRCTGALRTTIAGAARTGDGGELAELMAHCEIHEGAIGVLIAIAPRITAHRDELAGAFRLYAPPGTAERVPFETTSEAAQQRDLARLIGDTAAAQRWQAVIDAHAKMLGDRDKAVALIAWELL